MSAGRFSSFNLKGKSFLRGVEPLGELFFEETAGNAAGWLEWASEIESCLWYVVFQTVLVPSVQPRAEERTRETSSN